MTAAAFDTHSSVKTLTAAGMPEGQAEAITGLLKQSRDAELSTLAAKADLAAAKADLQHEIAELRTEIAETRADFLRALAETKADILKWVIGMVGGAVVFNAVTVVGAMIALIRIVGR